jgi:hypothetical protein
MPSAENSSPLIKEPQFQFELFSAGINRDQPLIYKWIILDAEGNIVGVYIGKAKSGWKRPTTHYRRNVNNILLNKPYRKTKVDQFRKIHRALAKASALNFRIELHFMCNVGPEQNINQVEREYMISAKSRGSEPWQLNG